MIQDAAEEAGWCRGRGRYALQGTLKTLRRTLDAAADAGRFRGPWMRQKTLGIGQRAGTQLEITFVRAALKKNRMLDRTLDIKRNAGKKAEHGTGS